MEGTFLSYNLNFIIIIPINAETDNIGGNTIYTSLIIRVKNRHKNSNIISNLWTAQYIIIVDKISMINPKMFFNIEKQLAKACGL